MADYATGRGDRMQENENQDGLEDIIRYAEQFANRIEEAVIRQIEAEGEHNPPSAVQSPLPSPPPPLSPPPPSPPLPPPPPQLYTTSVDDRHKRVSVSVGHARDTGEHHDNAGAVVPYRSPSHYAKEIARQMGVPEADFPDSDSDSDSVITVVSTITTKTKHLKKPPTRNSFPAPPSLTPPPPPPPSPTHFYLSTYDVEESSSQISTTEHREGTHSTYDRQEIYDDYSATETACERRGSPAPPAQASPPPGQNTHYFGASPGFNTRHYGPASHLPSGMDESRTGSGRQARPIWERSKTPNVDVQDAPGASNARHYASSSPSPNGRDESRAGSGRQVRPTWERSKSLNGAVQDAPDASNARYYAPSSPSPSGRDESRAGFGRQVHPRWERSKSPNGEVQDYSRRPSDKQVPTSDSVRTTTNSREAHLVVSEQRATDASSSESVTRTSSYEKVTRVYASPGSTPPPHRSPLLSASPNRAGSRWPPEATPAEFGSVSTLHSILPEEGISWRDQLPGPNQLSDFKQPGEYLGETPTEVEYNRRMSSAEHSDSEELRKDRGESMRYKKNSRESASNADNIIPSTSKLGSKIPRLVNYGSVTSTGSRKNSSESTASKDYSLARRNGHGHDRTDADDMASRRFGFRNNGARKKVNYDSPALKANTSSSVAPPSYIVKTPADDEKQRRQNTASTTYTHVRIIKSSESCVEENESHLNKIQQENVETTRNGNLVYQEHRPCSDAVPGRNSALAPLGRPENRYYPREASREGSCARARTDNYLDVREASTAESYDTRVHASISSAPQTQRRNGSGHGVPYGAPVQAHDERTTHEIYQPTETRNHTQLAVPEVGGSRNRPPLEDSPEASQPTTTTQTVLYFSSTKVTPTSSPESDKKLEQPSQLSYYSPQTSDYDAQCVIDDSSTLPRIALTSPSSEPPRILLTRSPVPAEQGKLQPLKRCTSEKLDQEKTENYAEVCSPPPPRQSVSSSHAHGEYYYHSSVEEYASSAVVGEACCSRMGAGRANSFGYDAGQSFKQPSGKHYRQQLHTENEHFPAQQCPCTSSAGIPDTRQHEVRRENRHTEYCDRSEQSFVPEDRQDNQYRVRFEDERPRPGIMRDTSRECEQRQLGGEHNELTAHDSQRPEDDQMSDDEIYRETTKQERHFNNVRKVVKNTDGQPSGRESYPQAVEAGRPFQQFISASRPAACEARSQGMEEMKRVNGFERAARAEHRQPSPQRLVQQPVRIEQEQSRNYEQLTRNDARQPSPQRLMQQPVRTEEEQSRNYEQLNRSDARRSSPHEGYRQRVQFEEEQQEPVSSESRHFSVRETYECFERQEDIGQLPVADFSRPPFHESHRQPVRRDEREQTDNPAVAENRHFSSFGTHDTQQLFTTGIPLQDRFVGNSVPVGNQFSPSTHMNGGRYETEMVKQDVMRPAWDHGPVDRSASPLLSDQQCDPQPSGSGHSEAKTLVIDIKHMRTQRTSSPSTSRTTTEPSSSSTRAATTNPSYSPHIRDSSSNNRVSEPVDDAREKRNIIAAVLAREWDGENSRPCKAEESAGSALETSRSLLPCVGVADEDEMSSKGKLAGPRGPRCLKCIDGCPGLDLHYFRKVCKHCRCPQEDHDLPASEDVDFRPISLLFDSTMTTKDGKVDWIARLEKLSLKDPGGLAQMCSPQNDVVISRLISENMRSQKYISMLPEDKQEFAAQLRRRQLQRQLPLHDLDPRFCTSLGEKEAVKYEKFIEKRRKKAAGIGQVGEISTTGVLKCHLCKKTMESGSPGVIAGRLPGECWHPGCFSCSTCRQLLVDNIYFCREGSVYCGRHYADQLYPRCSACDELIFAREYTQAEGRSWHVLHFCCWSCDTPLAGQRYIAKDDNPYCMMCFEKLYSKLCNTCQRPITSDHPGVTHNSYHWHACPHCFSCHACQRALMNQPFILRDGRLYCSSECQYRLNGCSHTASIARQYAT